MLPPLISLKGTAMNWLRVLVVLAACVAGGVRGDTNLPVGEPGIIVVPDLASGIETTGAVEGSGIAGKSKGTRFSPKNKENVKKGVTPPTNETQVDHVVPKSKGGKGVPDNGQILCRECNLKKGDKEQQEETPQ